MLQIGNVLYDSYKYISFFHVELQTKITAKFKLDHFKLDPNDLNQIKKRKPSLLFEMYFFW